MRQCLFGGGCPSSHNFGVMLLDIFINYLDEAIDDKTLGGLDNILDDRIYKDIEKLEQ